MTLLGGGIEAIFGEVFGALYLDATLHRDGAEPVYSEEGDIIGYEGGADVPAKVQLDSASYAMRQSEGFSDGDARLIILSAGLSVDVTTDHQVTVSGVRWMIASVDRDPAGSHYVCRGRRA